MPRAVFTGSLTFGLVNIPIRVYPATKSMGISFNLICGDCHAPLKYKRWCPSCEREVEWNRIERGYGITKEKIVALTTEELERLQLKTIKSIEIQRFVEGTSIDSIYFDAHYYLVPAEGGEKAYSLLHDVLSITNRVALGKVVMHNKEHVVAIRPYQKGLAMTTLHYADEVIDINKLEELDRLAAMQEKELELARVLVEHLAGDFKPEEYVDTYRQAVMQLVREKAEGATIPEAKPVEVGATVDLMKALEASVRATKKEKPALA